MESFVQTPQRSGRGKAHYKAKHLLVLAQENTSNWRTWQKDQKGTHTKCQKHYLLILSYTVATQGDVLKGSL